MPYEILDENGDVVNTIVADLAFVEEHFPGKFRELVILPAPPVETWQLSKRAFKARFPRAKWIAAKVAAASSPALADFFEDFELSSFIDVTNPLTVASVTALATPETPVEFRLTEAEVSAALNVPAAPDELP